MKLASKIKTSFFLWCAGLPMSGRARPFFVRLAGVKIGKNCFLGRGITFDSLCPERIRIGNHVHITTGCILLAHYLDTSVPEVVWKYGDIEICDDVFVGAGTVFAKPCKVGENAIVGAGSVLTKDVPQGEIWAGNPAGFIKKRAV